MLKRTLGTRLFILSAIKFIKNNYIKIVDTS